MIKIQSNDTMLHNTGTAGAHNKVAPSSAIFAEILAKTAQATAPRQVAASAPIQPVMRMTVEPHQEVYRSTERMLDSMVQYQSMLGDRGNSLRQVAPVIDQLKKQVNSLEPLLQSLDEKDPIAGIAREAMIVVNKEIIRFEAGAYVDEV